MQQFNKKAYFTEISRIMKAIKTQDNGIKSYIRVYSEPRVKKIYRTKVFTYTHLFKKIEIVDAIKRISDKVEVQLCRGHIQGYSKQHPTENIIIYPIADFFKN